MSTESQGDMRTPRTIQLDQAERHAQRALELVEQSRSAGNASLVLGEALVHAAATAGRER